MAILALDVGSSSVRAILFEHDATGVKLIPDAIVQREYSFDTTEPGQATVNPVFLRELLESCIDEILQHPQAKTIEAVGMDTFVGNWMLVGHSTPDSDLYTYADTRSATIIPNLATKIDKRKMHQQNGSMFHTAYYPAQIAWAQETYAPFVQQSEDLRLTDMIMDFASYCHVHWFTDVCTSYSVASWSGMMNRETLYWDFDWLDLLNLDEDVFPPLCDYTENSSETLWNTYYDRWSQLAEVPFYRAVGDGAAAQVGSGAVATGTATLTIGTTAAMRKVSTEKLPPVPQGCWSYRIDADHHLIGGALSEGGSIFAWARDTLKLDLDSLEDELAKREPAEHGLTVLPLFAGERSPGWRGDATGTIHGIRLSTTPLDMVHALLESVALRLAIVAQQLELADDVKIMASGGALTRSTAWAQIIADALQRPLYLLDEPEITALGTAHLAWCALNNQPVTGASPNVAQIIEPRTQYAAIMRELVEKQQELYRKFYV
jgi:gluconokinase